jgi:hypothetical protein
MYQNLIVPESKAWGINYVLSCKDTGH